MVAQTKVVDFHRYSNSRHFSTFLKIVEKTIGSQPTDIAMVLQVVILTFFRSKLRPWSVALEQSKSIQSQQSEDSHINELYKTGVLY